LARTTVPIVCFEGEIRQVLGNLIGNAIDAMLAEGGRLLLRSPEAISWSTGRKGTMLTIADSGGGISDEDLKNIFEVFFTAKGAKGNGLGLWNSKEIVDRHEGSLKVRSIQKLGGSGNVFTLFCRSTPLVERPLSLPGEVRSSDNRIRTGRQHPFHCKSHANFAP
jgi:signal transduction histidine kinase